MQKKIKKSNVAFSRYFQKTEFCAKFDLSSPITKDQKFSKKILLLQLFKFYGTLTSCQVSEKLNEAFSRNAHRGRTDGTEFIGPLSALLGVQKTSLVF